VPSAVRRALPLWLALMVVYTLVWAVGAGPGAHLSAPEAHRLLGAESLISDADLDLRDEYAQEAWRKFTNKPLAPAAGLTDGRLVEPSGIGFALLIAPAYRLGGVDAVRVFLAAMAALAFCLAAALGRRLVPDPWPGRAALVLGLSPPALGAAAAIAPEMVGATCLASAALLALEVRERSRTGTAFAGAALVAALPWLAAKLLAPAAVVAVALARWLRRRQRGMSGFIALEVALTSAVVYVTVNDRLFGGLTPHAVAHGGATGASTVGDYAGRVVRLATLWVDPDAGLLLWAPFTALAFVALWLLWRSRRDRLAVAVFDQVAVEAAAGFLALVAGAVLLVAVFLAPSLDGAWYPARQLVPALPPIAALCAWGLRFAPRSGTVLAALTLAASVYALVR
jgi:4-amino-4-deoxy-L-arabinose transferase-like glycosyltransferase